MRREVRYAENSRIDILLEEAKRAPCYVEIMNVHLMRQAGLAEFPRLGDGARRQAPQSSLCDGGRRGARGDGLLRSARQC
jgi:sugar fermentation stimulation protein A